MRFSDTEASKCRYGHIAESLFESCEIMWEDSCADWQGSAAVIGKRNDGSYVYYAWSYGSCSGCDSWEAAGYSEDQILDEMMSDAIFFDTVDELARFCSSWREKPEFLNN